MVVQVLEAHEAAVCDMLENTFGLHAPLVDQILQTPVIHELHDHCHTKSFALGITGISSRQVRKINDVCDDSRSIERHDVFARVHISYVLFMMKEPHGFA